MQTFQNRNGKLVLVGLLCLLCSACTNMWSMMTGEQTRKGVSGSLVDFLYPEGEIPPETVSSVPNLEVPLRIGLAFVPGRNALLQPVSEAEANRLLERVRAQFIERDFVSEIVVIPDAYLRSGRGFETLEQVSRLYDLDVMALVSYDQVSFQDDTRASIFYWTIVGAYLIEGSRNDVQTFVDTAIIDVATRKLLLRAPGLNRSEGTSTLVNSTEELREARMKSFDLAMEDMTANLDSELDRFVERIKTDGSVTVTQREGYGGGGAVDGLVLLALFGLWMLHLAGTRRTRDGV